MNGSLTEIILCINIATTLNGGENKSVRATVEREADNDQRARVCGAGVRKREPKPVRERTSTSFCIVALETPARFLAR